MQLFALLALFSALGAETTTFAFQIAPTRIAATTQQRFHHPATPVAGHHLHHHHAKQTALAVGVSTDEQTETITATGGERKEASMMDEGVYTFNKNVIDTVYDIICFLYPVTGTERDFARFYVLETVARVPYFAYLSVMHLRETTS
jgi:hypothetical protein